MIQNPTCPRKQLHNSNTLATLRESNMAEFTLGSQDETMADFPSAPAGWPCIEVAHALIVLHLKRDFQLASFRCGNEGNSTFRQRGVETHIDELSSKIGGCSSICLIGLRKSLQETHGFCSGEIWREGQCARRYQLHQLPMGWWRMDIVTLLGFERLLLVLIP